ncbi:MAG: DNA-processing protein DprA [Acidobacteriia bacterium]|nr:DNA-processing protein DprA [Terriglobia bacterium]
MTDLADYVALSLLPIWTWRAVAERLRAGDPPADILRQIADSRWPGQAGKVESLHAGARDALTRARAHEIAPTAWSDASYPVALATIVDPPPVLWTRGDAGALSTPAVAIVGARAASPYGLSVAGHLAADLATSGVTVISGLARGVDSAAHRGALAGHGLTVAVLGCGADVIYPPEHGALARDIEQRGAIVSELVPGTPPLPPFFPQRNRIISGLSRAVVVIEAGEKSGSLITARCALEQGRDVLAVPGNVLSGRNRGAHGLLRDGAKIVESADDILEELGMSQGDGSRRQTGTGVGVPQGSDSRPLDPILGCLTPGEPSDLDAIAERSGLSTARLLPRLFELEMRGVVARVGGGRFVRLDRTC